MAVMTDKLLTPQELAATYAVPVGWVYTHVRLRTIPHFKLGHYVRFDAAKVEAWL